MQTNDVWVIGAGPVGLLSALCLAERGINVQIADATGPRTSDNFATLLHPRSLRLLHEFGLADRLIRQAHRIERIALYEGRSLRQHIELSHLGGDYPFVAALRQNLLEANLDRALSERGVEVLWHHDVRRLEPTRDGVELIGARREPVTLDGKDLSLHWVDIDPFNRKARFLIGADGYYSLARNNVGAAYIDLRNTQSFAMFEFTSSNLPEHELCIIFSDEGLSAYIPLGDTKGRFMFQLWEGLDEPPNTERLRELIQRRAPWFKNSVSELYWSSVTHFDRALVDSFGKDRCWLAGDAAHVTSPVGAQSLNVGLFEAYDLGRHLADILSGAAPEHTLRAYADAQQQEWRMLLGIETEVRLPKHAPAWLKKHVDELVPCLPASGNELEQLLAQLDISFMPKSAAATDLVSGAGAH